MKSYKLTILAFFSLILLYVPAFAEYKIILKNGNEFIVDDYKDEGGRIKFFRMGGEIEIDKSSIESIKEVKARAYKATPETASQDLPAVKEAEKEPKMTRQDVEARLREIAKKKDEMKAEGKKLMEERKKLEEAIKKEGRVTYIREIREYEKQISSLEERIRRFNEEIEQLDKEQDMLLKQMQPQQKQQ